MNPASRFISVFAFATAWSSSAGAMTLSQALQEAVQRDPVVDISNAVFAAESQLGEQERSTLRPSVSVEGQGFQNRSDSKFAFGQEKDTYPSWSAYLTARQPLLRMDWFARGDRADLRDALAEEAQTDRRAQFIVRVCLRYLDTLLAEDRVRLAESEARAITESLSNTQKRYDVELVPGTDLKEAQARDDLSQARLLSERAALEDARDALQEITGYPRTPLPDLREDIQFPPLAPDTAAGWVNIAKQHNSALRLAELNVQLAKTNVESRKAEAMPSVDLIAEAGRNDSSEYSLGQRQDDARIGVEMKIPIYAGGYNTSRVREAEARLMEAEADLARVSLETERTMRTQFRAVDTAKAEAVAYDRALQSALLAQRATAAGYDAGTRTITDVLDAQTRVADANRNRNAARLNLLIKLLELNATSGTLTAEMLLAVDAVLFETP